MYYIEQDNKIVLFEDSLELLKNTLDLMPQYADLPILETDRPIVDFQFTDTEEYIAEQTRKETERISQLKMTRGDFFEGLILALGKDEDDVISLIDIIELSGTERKVYKRRVKNAQDFYRGYALRDVMSAYLGVRLDSMTQFFETKDYTYLIPTPEEITDGEVPDNEVDDTTVTDTTSI